MLFEKACKCTQYACMNVFMNVCMCVCIYVCIYICIYIYTDIERERERERRHITLYMFRCLLYCMCIYVYLHAYMFLSILQYGRNLLRIMLLLPGDPATCSLTDWRPLLTDFEMKNFDGYMKRWPGVFFHVQGHQWTSIYIYIHTQSQAIPNWGLLLGIALYFVSHIERCWFSFEHVFNSLFIYIYIYPYLSLFICLSFGPTPFVLLGGLHLPQNLGGMTSSKGRRNLLPSLRWARTLRPTPQLLEEVIFRCRAWPRVAPGDLDIYIYI